LSAIERSVQRTCFNIYERGQSVPAERGMGTTLSMLLLCGSRAFIGHVGDSRIYLIRGANIYQLTEDHSLLNELIKIGQPPDPDIVDSRFKNAVTRAVGVHPSVDVDTLDMEVLPGDRFLLCSDGLHRYGDPQSWLNIVMSAKDEKSGAKALIDYANEQGGEDNITAALVRVTEVPDAKAEETQLKLDTFRSLVLFRYLSYHELLKVLNLTHERLVKKGEYIFREGDLENCTYVLLKGRVQIRKANVIIAVLKEGLHFGEMALVDNRKRSADAKAMSDCWLMVIPRTKFFVLMRKNPELAVKLLWSFVKALTARLRNTNNELSLLKNMFQSVRPEDTGDLPDSWLQNPGDAELPAEAPNRQSTPPPPPNKESKS
jgi:CRP-like cAMP-binding protein